MYIKTKLYVAQSLQSLVIGKMKDESGGFGIKEFVGLKPKMYSFLTDDNSQHKKAKGVNKNVLKTRCIVE